MDWPLGEVCSALSQKIPSFKAQVVSSIDSTNTELMRRAKQGLTQPFLLVAEEQTAGKGRLGRVWHAKTGDSLTFSIGLNLRMQDWSGFSLVVGMGILRGLDPKGEHGIGLKWPNDLWTGPVQSARKLAGILIESSISQSQNTREPDTRYCVIGVGININAPKNIDLKRPAVGMNELESSANSSSVLLAVVPHIIENTLRFEANGFEEFQSEYSRYDILQGQQVLMSNGVTGRASGVNSRGELMIQTTSGVVPVISDEVSLVGLGV